MSSLYLITIQVSPLDLISMSGLYKPGTSDVNFRYRVIYQNMVAKDFNPNTDLGIERFIPFHIPLSWITNIQTVLNPPKYQRVGL